MRHFLSLFFVFLLVLLVACSGPDTSTSGLGGSTTRTPVKSEELQFQPPASGSITASFTTTEGTINVVLYPQYAPLAVENFVTLAESGYFNGTEFHRVVQDFIIQGGDATGTGTGGYSAWGHPFATEVTDKLHHYSGALCMASADGEPDTNESQFYIVATPQNILDEEAVGKLRQAGIRDEVANAYQEAGGTPYLDNVNTVFGQVYAGMDVVDKIAGVKVDDEMRPKNPVTIEKVTIHTGSQPDASGTSSSPSSSPATS